MIITIVSLIIFSIILANTNITENVCKSSNNDNNRNKHIGSKFNRKYKNKRKMDY